MQRRNLFALLAATAATAVTAPAMLTPAAAQVEFNVNIASAPPPVRYETVPAPRAGYVWAPGHWQWDGRRHIWQAGHWEAVRPGYRYVQPRYERYYEGGREHWRYHASRWDRDGDGIPNRYDRNDRNGPNGDRDGDGIANRYDNYDNRRGPLGDRDRDGIPNAFDPTTVANDGIG
jgi:hypothetical protein